MKESHFLWFPLWQTSDDRIKEILPNNIDRPREKFVRLSCIGLPGCPILPESVSLPAKLFNLDHPWERFFLVVKDFFRSIFMEISSMERFRNCSRHSISLKFKLNQEKIRSFPVSISRFPLCFYRLQESLIQFLKITTI